MLIFVFGVILLGIILLILNLAYVYINVDIDTLDRYIYTLLYRGFEGDNIFQSAELGLRSIDRKWRISITKYKERGTVGLYLAIELNFEDDKKERCLIEKLKEYPFEHQIREMNEKIVTRFLLIDVKKDLLKIKELIKFIWKSIFDQNEEKVDLNLHGICRKSGETRYFPDATPITKEIIAYINIPTKNIDLLMSKLKIREFNEL